MSVPQLQFAAARLNRRGQDMYKLIDGINAKRSATPDANEQVEYLKQAMSASQAAHEARVPLPPDCAVSALRPSPCPADAPPSTSQLMLLAEMAANFAVLTEEKEKLQAAHPPR